MNVEAELKEIEQITSKIAELSTDRRSKRQDLAELLCPFTIGQRVLNHRGEEREIVGVSPTDFPPFYDFKVCKIKKDGSRFENSQDAHYKHEYTVVVGEG